MVHVERDGVQLSRTRVWTHVREHHGLAPWRTCHPCGVCRYGEGGRGRGRGKGGKDRREGGKGEDGKKRRDIRERKRKREGIK